jgi:hypothetical protein
MPWRDSMRQSCKILYISWVAGSNSSLVVFAQVMVFAIAQASKFKSYFWKPKLFGHSAYATVVRIENGECSCWKVVELFHLSWTFSTELSFFSWVEFLQQSWAFQLSWTFSAELSFLNWVELLQLSWAFSVELNLTSTVKLSSQNQLNMPPSQFNMSFLSWTFWSIPVELALSLGQLPSLTYSLPVCHQTVEPALGAVQPVSGRID